MGSQLMLHGIKPKVHEENN